MKQFNVIAEFLRILRVVLRILAFVVKLKDRAFAKSSRKHVMSQDC